MTIINLPHLNTRPETAAKLRCCPRTVARLHATGKLGFTRIAGKVFTTDAQIAAYVENNSCTATSK